MKSLLLIMVFWWVAAGAGRSLIGRFEILMNMPLERSVFASAFGLALAAGGVFALGMVSLLSFWPVTVWWLVLTALGLSGMRSNLHDLQNVFNKSAPSSPTATASAGMERVVVLLLGAVLCLCAVIAVVGCFVPPTPAAWDALSYHLADPKVFLQQGRISSLPTEHHSNFPFIMEMLFAIGLLYDGYSLANLFHLLTTVLTVLAIIGFGTRHFSRLAGFVAATIFATTPLVLWEASVAYTDLGMGLYTTLAALACVSAIEAWSQKGRDEARGIGTGANRAVHFWALLAGIMLGVALGIKYLALIPLLLVAGALLLSRIPLKTTILCIGVAVLIGSPWYLKNLALTGNPVYPYLYSVFPNSRYWSQDRAEPYQAEQAQFGYSHSLRQPRESLLYLVQTPWRLTANPERYANPANFSFSELIGGLYAALGMCLLFLPGVPPLVKRLLALALMQVVAWFFLAQVGRYLLSVLPLLALCGGYVVWRLRSVNRIVAGSLLVGQIGFLLYSVFVLPSGFMLAEGFAVLTQPDSREALLRRRLGVYASEEWINTSTPVGAGVVLFEETHGFYLDRPYLWGNGEHSGYIPYDSLADGAALTAWFQQHGIRYALFNLRWTPGLAAKLMQENQRPEGNEEAALYRFYVEEPLPVGGWKYRLLIQDALRRGLWKPVFAKNGVVVLAMEEEQKTSQRLPESTEDAGTFIVQEAEAMSKETP